MQIRAEKVRLNSSDIKQIYFEAFPKKERMPFPMMVAMSKLWNTQFMGFYDNSTLCGFVYLAHNSKIVFIMFLAVDRSLRGKGYGSAILKEVKARYPNRKIIISIETCDEDAPDIELRKRRKAFYLRNGYQETGYIMKLGGVVQEILITNGEFIKKEFQLFFVLYSNGTIWPPIGEKHREHKTGYGKAGLEQFNWLFRLCGFVFVFLAAYDFVKGDIGMGLPFLAFGSVLLMSTGKKRQ